MFGAAERAKMLTEALALVGVRIDGYFDNAYIAGGKNEYFEIMPIACLEKLNKNSSYFIVGSYREKEISSQLRSLGFSQIFYQNQFAMTYNEKFGEIKFKYQKEPEVSILVTAFNGWNMTYNALKSLAENENICKYEIILGDDCSEDLTIYAEKYLENVKVVHHKERMQYLGNVNAIAKEARGEYLFLLANDVLFTQKGYIDILLNEIKKDQKIGMLTGKLWMPYQNKYDTHWIYEQWDQLVAAELEYPRNVEEMCPVATLIPKRVWTEVGGFDKAFFPVYYEDNDLAMRIIEAGFDLVGYPNAEVIHYVGGSYQWDGKDVLLQKNKALFKARWKGYIEGEKEKRKSYLNAR